MIAKTVSLLLLIASTVAGQKVDDVLLTSMRWRHIGPFRGGRSAACTGVVGDRNTYYFGACGGGVWKTTDAGRSWRNVSDGFFGGSIGAVAVSDSDPNVVYAGGGEVSVRGNVSHGGGVWKSTDAGKTWEHVGLSDTRHIPRIRIHPDDPDTVWVAALGHLFGPNEQRGVFRSKDGGKTWKRVLFANANAGACDLCLDPTNARVLYASTWRVRLMPHALESGGEGSKLWKSTDSGDTWDELSDNSGMPKGTIGIIGVAVAPSRPERVWAQVENENGGIFRSENGGKTWSKVNSERMLRQRAWYYTRIAADPKDADVLYAMNVSFYRSKDAGKSFTKLGTPHGDNHDMWIDPHDPLRMIEANDGGANVSFDGGRNWSRQDNQPTAQFYRVTTDNHFPYRIYGAQQDNSTVRILSRGRNGIGERDWERTAGGESGHIAPHPKDPEIVFGGSYGGYLTMLNHRTGEFRSVHVWPDNPMGSGAGTLKYRFQWNFPLFFSQHEPHTLYTAAQVLFKSDDLGESWTPISGDLTRNDKSRLGPSGGPITKDNTGVEYYATIFAACESPHQKGVFWCGSDDGLLWLTKNGGQAWTNVTPKGFPEWTQVNSIEPHPSVEGGLYVAATSYKSDDFAPYLFRTTDWGKTWKKITRGISEGHFTRVIRADPKRKGLLYAGTEAGAYVSFDDGGNWQSLQRNLPIVPITDLCVKNGDLIAATQGRAFWVMDDLTPLQQLSAKIAAAKAHLFKPRTTYLMGGGRGGRGNRGKNPPSGAVLTYWVRDRDEDVKKRPVVKLEILEASGEVVKTYSTKSKKRGEKLTVAKGMNRFTWNMSYPDAMSVPGMVMWGGGTRGPRAAPGTYRARLAVGEQTMTTTFVIARDPRSSATDEDLRAQFALLIEARDKLSETHEGILTIRDVRSQVQTAVKRSKGADGGAEVAGAAKSLTKALTSIEEALYQTKNKSSQDPLNFPIRLNNKLAAAASSASTGSFRPTKQQRAVIAELSGKIDSQLSKLEGLLGEDLPAFNDLVRSKAVPAVVREKKGATTNGK